MRLPGRPARTGLHQTLTLSEEGRMKKKGDERKTFMSECLKSEKKS
jgi:psiF repeat